jgi:hypothetical protein
VPATRPGADGQLDEMRRLSRPQEGVTISRCRARQDPGMHDERHTNGRYAN